MFTNPYEEASYKERLFFNNLIKLYNIFPEDKYYISETPYTDTANYDYIIFDKNKYKRFIVEIKIRTKAFEDGYVYEKNKHQRLTKAKDLDPENNTIMYINSTPNGTYIWNIDKIISKYKLTKREMNSHTVISKEKENKDVYLLNTQDAFKHFEYHWDDKQYDEHIAEKYVKETKIMNRINEDKNTIFKLLFEK